MMGRTVGLWGTGGAVRLGRIVAAGGRGSIIAVHALVLGGCGGTSTVSDELTTSSLANEKSGVAILKASIIGQGCPGGTLTIGRKAGDAYEAVTSVQTGTGAFTSGLDVMQVTLPPGDYHVINIACAVTDGRITTTVQVGKKEGGGLLGIGSQFKKSLATFQLGTGEIVNLGYLQIVTGLYGTVAIAVSDLPAESAARLKKEKPNLANQMTTRLMVVTQSPRTPAETKQFCDQLALLNAQVPAFARPLPAECTATAAAPAVAPAVAAGKKG